MPKFSITSPVWIDRDAPENKRQPRYEMFLRAANSVFGQTYKDFEWVIADDISTPPVEEILEENNNFTRPEGMKVKIIRLPEKGGRIIARNAAMKAATGDWICWFDSDDELSSIYLEALSHAIDTYPEFKVFNFNHLVFHYNYDTTVRKFMNMEVQGKEPFGSGNIGAGAFVFHRSVYEEIGSMPEVGLWDFAKIFFEKHPETMKFFESSEHPGQYNSLGNPHGDDYYYFYEITRRFDVKYLNTALYFVHSRFGHRWPEEPEIEGNMGDKPEWDSNNR
ncbi:glycosyltransferase [Candidatus Dojkabacteria bacterium]|jgi:glycosyltransferase involved in cell wall biosynthesis|nr:glycosyltransferase [Candidatus Dojkabacteria bacterium]